MLSIPLWIVWKKYVGNRHGIFSPICDGLSPICEVLSPICDVLSPICDVFAAVIFFVPVFYIF